MTQLKKLTKVAKCVLAAHKFKENHKSDEHSRKPTTYKNK